MEMTTYYESLGSRLDQSAANLQEVDHNQLRQHLGKAEKSLLWRGILAIAIGVLALAWPGITVQAFVILFAAYAFLAAATDAVRAFSSDGAGRVAGYLLLSALSFGAGVVALAWPGITAMALTLWIAAWAIITGGVEVALAFRRHETAGERALWALGGLITIALGLALAIRPDLGALTLATAFGLFSIVNGTSALVLAIRARRLGKHTHLLAEAIH